MRMYCLLLPLLLIACGVPTDQREPMTIPEGRAETRNIRNTDAVGYDGSGIANKLDAALDANDRRRDELEAQLDAQR